MSQSIKEFFTVTLPGKIASLGDASFPDLKDKVQFSHVGGDSWNLSFEGGKPKLNQGVVKDALVYLAFEDAAFDKLLTELGDRLNEDFSGRTDQIAGMLDPAKAEKIRNQQGTIKLTLSSNEGAPASIAIGFGDLNYDAPRVAITIAENLFNQIRANPGSAQSVGMQGFMSGQIKIDGDMSYAMSLQGLMS